MSPPNRADPLHSHTFLLTLWCEREDGPWRAALRPADGRARMGFADLEQLVALLLALADHRAAPADEEADERSADRQ